ncbi:hypothetical protein [Bradyrhizobium ivorense]|uniref:hypothetical protein n=1 Tax=Bradyrhizobium ivorense TaxID=2511166 RepID=UPI00111DC0B3|nr:hypothetical protein [Bradyrhizobium ivorense]
MIRLVKIAGVASDPAERLRLIQIGQTPVLVVELQVCRCRRKSAPRRLDGRMQINAIEIQYRVP